MSKKAPIYYGDLCIVMPEAGEPAIIVEDMSIEDYHDLGNFQKHGENGVASKSMLGEMSCPAKVKWKYFDGGLKPDRDYFNVGNAVHTLALEPKKFDERFYVLEKGIVRNAKHEKYQAALEEAAGRKVITANDLVDIKGMAAAVTKSKTALALLDAPGKVEPSIFWTDAMTGIRCRCRPDFLRDDGLIVDLKTAASADLASLSRTAFDKHYDLSVAMTTEGVRALTGKTPDNYVFLAIEKDAPYVIEAYDAFRPWDPDDMSKTTYLDAGAFRLRKALDKFAQCRKSGIWPGYNEKIMPMSVPGYALKQIENND